MSDIASIDKNFAVPATVQREDMRFYDPQKAPFSIHGVYWEDGKYRRMPENVAKSVSDGVWRLHANTAGGRIRFVTDSPYVVIHAEMKEALGKMSHFALTGSIGFDLYADGVFVKTFIPPFTVSEGFDGEVPLPSKQLREITINLPLYSDVNAVYIGLREDAVVQAAKPYRNEKPVVYYGSSITQGGCASRPGRSYQSILERRFNIDYVNLGFSGNARAEDTMIEYLKNLDMSMFVLDYDHNAPSPEHLWATHEKLFKAVRAEHPDIPIIMMSRPKIYLLEQEVDRRRCVETTYKNALAAGDKNVYFLDGTALMAYCGNEGTVDGCHPTDYGFASMAMALENVMKDILD